MHGSYIFIRKVNAAVPQFLSGALPINDHMLYNVLHILTCNQFHAIVFGALYSASWQCRCLSSFEVLMLGLLVN